MSADLHAEAVRLRALADRESDEALFADVVKFRLSGLASFEEWRRLDERTRAALLAAAVATQRLRETPSKPAEDPLERAGRMALRETGP